MAFDTFPAVVTRTHMVTPTVLCLGFKRQDGQLLDFKPGHFVNVHFQDEDGETHRSYSVANPPGEDHFEIAVAPVEDGRATRYLFGLKEGDQVNISGPYGRFVLRDEIYDRYVLVGTGTGITPYRAMLPQLAQRMKDSHARVEVLIGVRSREEFLFADDFLAAAQVTPGVVLHARYSRQMPGQPQSYESQGYVQGLFEELELDPEQDIVYLCGNPNMIDEAVSWLKARGFPVKRIRREKYLSANA